MPSRPAYSGTEVPVSKSQEDLRKQLISSGAEQFSFGQGSDWAGVEFVHAGHLVRLRCPVKPGNAAMVKAHHSSEEKQRLADEREHARVWRVLVWSVKARLVAVDEGLESFEQAFLPHIVDPGSGRTLWETVRVEIEAGALRLDGGGLKALGAGGA